MKILLFIMLSLISLNLFSQIGIGTTSPNTSSILDVSSSNKGFLPPRMSEFQRNTINNPAEGLIVYCKDCCGDTQTMSFYNGTKWINIPDCFDRASAVKTSGATSINSDGFITMIGNDRKLYTWGQSRSSSSTSTGNGEALGAGLISPNLTIDKKPTPVVVNDPNPENIQFIQVSTGYLESAIALTRTGRVYGAGLTDRGSGNLSNPNTFTRITMGTSDPTIKLLGSCEGGSIAIGDNDKAYFWGYVGFPAFNSWQSQLPKEVDLPIGVTSADVIGIGGSYHYMVIATSTNIYFTGTGLPWHFSGGPYNSNAYKYDGSWFKHPKNFSNIESFSAGRNIVLVTDNSGSYTITDPVNNTQLDFSAITSPIVEIHAGGINKYIYVVTNDKIYYKVSPSNFSGAGEIDIPVGYSLIQFLPGHLAGGRYYAKLKKNSDNTIHYFGGKAFNNTIGYTGALLGGFLSYGIGQLDDLGLDVSLMPTNVELSF